ncbi:hypothetical protein ACJJTC_007352 [Scirpophaga incertulas]
MDCTGCREALSELNSLKCNACDSHYCLECLCLDTNKKSSELNQDQLSALKCPSCTNVSRRKRGGKDSVFSPSVMKPKHNIENILTIEKISNLLDQKLAPKSSIMIALRKELIQDVKSMIAIETSKIVNEIKDEFTKTTEFIMDEIKVLKSGLSERDIIIKTLQSDQIQLKDELKQMQSRFSAIERLSRARNIEIQSVPDNNKNENVISMFKTLCNTLKFPVSDSDIYACRRVAKMDTSNKRPRNIIVTLNSPSQRDGLISAAQRFNKENNGNRLNTLHLGMAGESHQIYVAEHLDPETKQLFAAARKFKRDKNYAYCWVKYGKIYLRKNDNTDAKLVTSQDFLNNLN